ncbi:MAG TPA: serine/threonine-protein kinase, partial [Polyangia bacterium]
MRHCTQCGAATPDDARFCPRCGAPVIAPSANDPMIGKVVAERYKLVEKIGQGSSGAIYRGEHTTLHKKVAVKLLHAQLSTDDTALERFRREATTVAEIENEHILQVLDYGRSDDNRLFFAMEFLEGETLTKVIEREKRLPIDRALDILSQICEGLIEAHGLGYVHRDLRPRNVFLVNRRGRADFVKLLDFGLAKLILPDAEAKQTAMGMTFGDPRYMSPEQARGEALDRRSDIYSLGAIAFEMLTGSPPYTGSGTFEILQQHLDAPVPKVRDQRPDCPPWLDAAVQRALAKKPDGRFDTVAKVLEALRAEQQRPVAAAAKPAPVAAPPPVESMGPTATQPLPAPAAPARTPS